MQRSEIQVITSHEIISHAFTSTSVSIFTIPGFHFIPSGLRLLMKHLGQRFVQYIVQTGANRDRSIYLRGLLDEEKWLAKERQHCLRRVHVAQARWLYEADVGAAGGDAPVGGQGWYTLHNEGYEI